MKSVNLLSKTVVNVSTRTSLLSKFIEMSTEESFFNLARTLCYATRFLGVNGFSFPPKRGVGMKLYNNRMSIAAVVVPLVVMFSLDVMRVIVSQTSDSIAPSLQSLTDSVKTLVIVFLGRIQALINIFFDVKNRSKIWFIICSLCDYDIVVSISLIFKIQPPT